MGVDMRPIKDVLSELVLILVGDDMNDVDVRYGGFLRMSRDNEGIHVFAVNGTELEAWDHFMTTQGEVVEFDEAFDFLPGEFGGLAVVEVSEDTDVEIKGSAGEIRDFLQESAAEEQQPVDETPQEEPVS